MRCLPRKDVLFGGLVDNATHFRGSNPEPPILGVWNRHFQAKRAKFITFRLSKLLHRSQHSFLYNDTDHQILFMGGPNMRQLALEVGGRPPFCKKNDKSPYLGNGSTSRHEIWHSYAERPSTVIKDLNFKNPSWQTAAILGSSVPQASQNAIFTFWVCIQNAQIRVDTKIFGSLCIALRPSVHPCMLCAH